MNDSEIASIELTKIINDMDAERFFAKDGLLSWFSLKKMFVSAYRKGNLSDKVLLIWAVFKE